MTDIENAYAFVLSAMSKHHDILMNTVKELDAVRNIEMENRTEDQKVELDRILKERRPYETAWHRLEDVRQILLTIYKM